MREGRGERLVDLPRRQYDRALGGGCGGAFAYRKVSYRNTTRYEENPGISDRRDDVAEPA